ncbi:hypothetical protein CEE45_01690 [Candidatus Heimdallarchaeota archaeon B3_Heim]|nr:MAG: hypothetical protein CEE45_01690 [Candidatus Heimdallarchaeota archaeon B3_Heim]
MTRGVYEWANCSINFQSGCKAGCEYCYARLIADRTGWKKWDDWTNPVIRTKDVVKNYRKRNGRIMFPSSHNIDSGNIVSAITILKKLTRAHNEVLVVLKPTASIIRQIIKSLGDYIRFVEFRFTITTFSDLIRGPLEPYASSIPERMFAIKEARLHMSPNRVSVSIEPFLDHDPTKLIHYLIRNGIHDYNIWLGPMNHRNQLKQRSPVIRDFHTGLELAYGSDNLRKIHGKLNALGLRINYKDGFLKQMEAGN